MDLAAQQFVLNNQRKGGYSFLSGRGVGGAGGEERKEGNNIIAF